jgi:hypothetical protein
MTAALGADFGWHKATRVAAAVAFVAGGVDVLVGQSRIRTWEAAGAARIGSWFGVIRAESLGNSVVFPLGGRWVGYSLTTGCTVALLVSPFFFLLAAVMLAGPRISIGRALFTLVTICVLLVTVNQLRMLAVAGSMRIWGFKTGYERGHVLLGTVVSTVGLVGALLVFLLVLTRGGGRRGDLDGPASSPLSHLRRLGRRRGGR